jgi:hypothetical protein
LNVQQVTSERESLLLQKQEVKKEQPEYLVDRVKEKVMQEKHAVEQKELEPRIVFPESSQDLSPQPSAQLTTQPLSVVPLNKDLCVFVEERAPQIVRFCEFVRS